MDFEFTENQEMFRNSIRNFFQKECPRTLVREIENNKVDYSLELHKKMADLGFLGLMIPEEYGGAGGNWVDTTIFYEEAGRALLQSPHHSSVILTAQSVLAFGDFAQKKLLLPEICRGESTYAFAASEADPGLRLNENSTAASQDANGFELVGSKQFVSFAQIADRILVVAKTGLNEVALFIINQGSPGLTYRPFHTMNGERLYEVSLDKVKVTPEWTVGSNIKSDAVEEIIDKANLFTCAYALGGAQVVLDMIVEYAKQRIIFNHPIGSFQALQHKLADIALDIEGAKWLIYSAAWQCSHDIDCRKERAMAQLYIKDIWPRIAEDVTHCHGAIALVKDHDMTLYFRRAKSVQLNFRLTDSYIELIADAIGI